MSESDSSIWVDCSAQVKDAMPLRIVSRSSGLLGTLALLCATALWACSDSDGDVRGAGAAPELAAVGGACTQPNATEACDCPGGLHGRRVCTASLWQPCECTALVPVSQGVAGSAGIDTGVVVPAEDFSGNLRTDVTFPWKRDS